MKKYKILKYYAGIRTQGRLEGSLLLKITQLSVAVLFQPMKESKQGILNSLLPWRIIKYHPFAGVAELADAPDLGSGGFTMQVQVLSPAP